MRLAAERLGPLAAAEPGVEDVRRSYLDERDAWDLFYDALESDTRKNAPLGRIIEGARVVT